MSQKDAAQSGTAKVLETNATEVSELALSHTLPITKGVDERLDSHELFLSSNGREGKLFDARGENLTGIDFRNRKMGGANFTNCTLDNALFFQVDTRHNGGNFFIVFVGCRFIGTNFVLAKLPRALFQRCEFSDTLFRGAFLADALIEYSVSKKGSLIADFGGADLERTRIQTNIKDMGYFILSKAKIRKTRFRGIDFHRKNFGDVRGSNISESTFVSCNLKDCVFSLLKGYKVTFEDCDLTNASFWKTEFPEATFKPGCVLKEATFGDATLTSVTMAGIDAQDASFIDTNFSKQSRRSKRSTLRLSNFGGGNANKFKGANLAYADLSGANLLGVKMDPSQTILNFTNFQGATWEDGERCQAGSIGYCVKK